MNGAKRSLYRAILNIYSMYKIWDSRGMEGDRLVDEAFLKSGEPVSDLDSAFFSLRRLKRL